MRNERNRIIWQLLLLVPLTLFLLSIFPGCQAEMAKWDFARAMIEMEEGSTESATARMKAVVAKSPTDDGLKMVLAIHLSEQGDRESLRLCDEVLENYPARLSVIFNKSLIQNNLGDHEDGLATYKTLLSGHVGRSRMELNNLAYYRGLAKKELMLAASNIKAAIDEEQQDHWPWDRYLPMTIRAALAIGILSRPLERQEAAVEMLSAHVGSLESDCETLKRIISLIESSPTQLHLDSGQDLGDETELTQKRLELTRSVLATVLSVRALTYQDLGREQECNEDRYRVKELGFDSVKIAHQLPSDLQCCDDLNTATMFLDTRGFVCSLLPFNKEEATAEDLDDPLFRTSSYREAIQNLDLAVMSAEYIRLVLRSPLFNTPMFSPADVHKQLASATRSEAVLLMHRVQLNQLAFSRTEAKSSDELSNRDQDGSDVIATKRRAGDGKEVALWKEEIELDRARIKALGFDPDSNLF